MKQVPHVLHLVNSFKQGGSEQQAVQLIRLLHETGRYRIFVAVQNGVGPLRHEIENLPPSELVEFPLSSFHDRKAIGQWRRFRRYVREHRIDIVQTHDFYTNIFGLFGAAISGVPVRVASRRETTGTRSRAQKLVERASFRFADAIVANSEAVRTQLVREGIRQQKISVIYNGVDVRSMTVEPGFDRARALTRLHLPVSPQFQFVTLLANMRLKVKDHPMFLRAAKAVAETLPDARFVLAGEGELTDALRTAAREMGIADKVCFVGECSRVVELLAVSDVCVLSSKAEGLSNSILEYMAAARPVVVTDVGAAREIVTDGQSGYLVPSGDHAQMAGRIVILLNHPDRGRQMGRVGQQMIAAKFSCAARLEKTERLYQQLLNDRRERT